jgi:hypothetical protein
MVEHLKLTCYQKNTELLREHPIFATTGGESIPRLIVQVLLRGLLL